MENRRRTIEAAFRQLPLLPDKNVLLHGAVDILSQIDTAGPSTAPSQFTIVGRGRTKKELERLIVHLDKLAHHLEELHQPAIVALADAGLSRLRLELPGELQAIANLVQQIMLDKVLAAPKGGKPENKRAHAIATIAAYYYRLLTGKRPTRRIDAHAEQPTSYGPFMDLLGAIYDALGVKVNTEEYARAAISRERKGQT